MPGYNSDVLPSEPYLNIGSPTQPWNGYFGTINEDIQVLFGNNKLTYISTPTLAIDASSSTVIEVDLFSNVAASTFTTNTTAGRCQFLLFRLIQDSVGGWTFAWPTQFKGAIPVDNISLTMAANQVAQQMFLYDKSTNLAIAIAPAVLYP